jgi:large repetitive protein
VTRKPNLTVKFRFGSTEPGSSFQRKLGRTPFRSCNSPKRYRIKATDTLKKHTLQLRAIDAAGNVDPTPAKRFKVRLID